MDFVAADAPPRSLFAWPTFLWSRVLFRGDRPGGDEPRRSPLLQLLVLLFVPALLLYPCLSFPLIEPDESRYAEIPREMLQRGDWITPRLQGEPYLEKPPLLYWLTAVSYRLFGVHDWAARLPPALAVHGSVLVLYFFGRRLFGERAAFRGALDAEPGAGLRQHRPAAAHRRRPDVLHHAGPVRRVRGGARLSAALELVAAVGGRVRPRRPRARGRSPWHCWRRR